MRLRLLAVGTRMPGWVDTGSADYTRRLGPELRLQIEELALGKRGAGGDTARAVADALTRGRAERGIIVCGSGAGVSIAANKVPGIRAAVCHDTYTAHQAVEHDDMNVLCLGARVVGGALATEIVSAFLNARFSGEARHRRRLDKVLALEREFARPAAMPHR